MHNAVERVSFIGVTIPRKRDAMTQAQRIVDTLTQHGRRAKELDQITMIGLPEVVKDIIRQHADHKKIHMTTVIRLAIAEYLEAHRLLP